MSSVSRRPDRPRRLDAARPWVEDGIGFIVGFGLFALLVSGGLLVAS